MLKAFNTIERVIPVIVGVMTLIVAGAAFILSFANLQQVAINSGVSWYLSWAWPVCVDALLVAGSLMVLYANLNEESSQVGWLVLLSFTAVSIYFNMANSIEGTVNMLSHAVPPVALMVSIEGLMRVIRSEIRKNREESHGLSLAKEGFDPVSIPEKVMPDVMVPGPEQEQKEPDIKPRITMKDSAKVILDFIQSHPGKSGNDVARETGLSQSTAKKWIKTLVDQGLLVRTETGLQVVEGV